MVSTFEPPASANLHHESIAPSDPLKTATGVYVTVHGHFYQPPRENPYLDAIERQPSANPCHDWNERVHAECYRPNAFARILNDNGEIVSIVNNFEHISFNIGPTLMAWMERHDPQTYQRIIEADRLSCDRFNGHGNAIAQVYNHIILPLANDRDKRTQIHWGKTDFRTRFGRDPEGMWLAETAVDYATLKILVDEGIKFIILAPSQVERCREMPAEDNPDPQWHEVGGGQIDPTRPYRCYLDPHGDRDENSPYIDVFFYDGPISRDMGFNDVLESSHNFAGRLNLAVRGDRHPAQLISVATDGETFGHHKYGKEKCLAYAVTQEFPRRGWTTTNYAHYLSLDPPNWEAELKPVTAWSCSHGVDRWQDDCGCGGGGLWNQQWRRPLREALNWLRDQLAAIYETEARKLLGDPWEARNAYVSVILDRAPASINSFLRDYQARSLTPQERIDALRLLEMQRHTLLMFTSCGWFFDELSRPEGVQILRYAARAIELAAELTGTDLEPEFVQRLEAAPSNVDVFKNGAEVYRHLVTTAIVSLEQVAAHYAIASLYAAYPTETRVYCYEAKQLDYQLQRLGTLTLAVGQLQLKSEITRDRVHFIFAVLHLGGWDFHCCVQPFKGRRAYAKLKEAAFAALSEASAARAILALNQHFDGHFFSLQDLFAEERHRIMELLNRDTLGRLDRLYAQVYRDNYGVMMAFHRDEMPVPKELQVAAEIAFSQRCLQAVETLDVELTDLAEDDGSAGLTPIAELEALVAEAQHMRCALQVPEATSILERLVLRSLWHLLHSGDRDSIESQIDRLEKMLSVGDRLQPSWNLDKVQELYYGWLHGDSESWHNKSAAVVRLLRLGKQLKVDVSARLK